MRCTSCKRAAVLTTTEGVKVSAVKCQERFMSQTTLDDKYLRKVNKERHRFACDTLSGPTAAANDSSSRMS